MRRAANFVEQITESLGPPAPWPTFVTKTLWGLLRQIPALLAIGLGLRWLTGDDLLKEICLGGAAGFTAVSTGERTYRIWYWRRRVANVLWEKNRR